MYNLIVVSFFSENKLLTYLSYNFQLGCKYASELGIDFTNIYSSSVSIVNLKLKQMSAGLLIRIFHPFHEHIYSNISKITFASAFDSFNET